MYTAPLSPSRRMRLGPFGSSRAAAAALLVEYWRVTRYVIPQVADSFIITEAIEQDQKPWAIVWIIYINSESVGLKLNLVLQLMLEIFNLSNYKLRFQIQ